MGLSLMRIAWVRVRLWDMPSDGVVVVRMCRLCMCSVGEVDLARDATCNWTALGSSIGSCVNVFVLGDRALFSPVSGC